MPFDEENAYKLWRIKINVLQMCKDRNYIVSQDELDEPFESFKTKFENEGYKRDALNTAVTHKSEITKRMYVLFTEEPKLSIKTIKQYCMQMQNQQIFHAILLLQGGGITPSAKQAISDLAPRYIIETFMESELLVNITRHQFVPQHEPLTKEEKQELLERYRLRDTQLPRMQMSDPVARYYGLRRGQVVRITRRSETAGRYTTYRLVV